LLGFRLHGRFQEEANEGQSVGFVRVWKIKVRFFFETTKDAIDFLGFYHKPGGGYLNFIKITFNFWFLKI